MLSGVQIISDTLPALVKLRDSGKASAQNILLPSAVAGVLTTSFCRVLVDCTVALMFEDLTSLASAIRLPSVELASLNKALWICRSGMWAFLGCP